MKRYLSAFAKLNPLFSAPVRSVGTQIVDLSHYFLKVPLYYGDYLVYRINDAILTALLNVFPMRTHLRNFTVVD